MFLDEPTDYLDRDGWGALDLTVQDFKRCCDGVDAEKWFMKGDLLRIEGESVDAVDQNRDGNSGPDGSPIGLACCEDQL